MDIFSFPSPHFDERTHNPDMILIHYTDMVSAKAALDWLVNPASRVSAHYLIEEGGKIYTLVDEAKRAWHAGESFWQGKTGVNDFSIGIELVNPGHSYGYVPFPKVQIASLIALCHQIKERWAIPPSRILGHSDVAPRRKQDPGHLFPWKKLCEEGLGIWPSFPAEPVSDVAQTLADIGYETLSLSAAIAAFQRHFQPHKVDGKSDEETRRLLSALKYGLSEEIKGF